MSALRNAIPQKNYQERSQPGSRARHGLLEKKKDYRLRARDHNLKKAKLRALQAKARDRNPDEFYYGMHNASTTKQGRKTTADGGRGNESLSNDVVKLMKTQDVGYIRTMLERTRRERERLEGEIMLVQKDGEEMLTALGGQGKSRHKVFVEDEEAQKAFNAEEWFGTDEKGLSVAFNRPRKASEQQELVTGPKRQLQTKKAKQELETGQTEQANKARLQDIRIRRLDDVKTRERELRVAERALELQRAKMNSTIEGTNKQGVKFRVRQRKR